MATASLNDGFAGAEDGAHLRYPRRLARVLSAVPGNGPLNIIDVGSAAGTISMWLAGFDQRFHVTGVDYRADLVEQSNQRARARDAKARFVVADAGQFLPARNGLIDGAAVHRLRDGLVSRSERLAMIDELRRVLRPGGWVSLLEDMRVEPRERHGEWYARRYVVSGRVVELLLADGHPGLEGYSAWLADPDAALLMSLREPDGRKTEDVAYYGREKELATAISDGRVRVRGIGIHQAVRRVRDDFAARGLAVRQRWRVEMAEPPPRAGHATVMKGLLLQRDDLPAV